MGIFSKSTASSSKPGLLDTGTLGCAQISLTILEKLADSIPVPFVKSIVGASVEVIKIARAIHANRKDCDELIKRSSSLLVVILSSLKTGTEAEIPEELKQGLERLATNFQEVLTELRTIYKRAGKRTLTGFPRSVLYHYDNADALKSCSAKLDWAMQEFQVISKVDSCLRHLEHHQELIQHQAKLHQGQKDILEAMKEKAVVNVVSDLPSTRIPANPRIFGRDDYVATAVKLVLSENTARVAILGPGGMGKTSVALKIIHDTKIVTRFGKSIHWVPCEQATSVPLLVELLAKSLHLPTSSSNDRLDDVITALESSNNHHLFLLDNFETPWDIPTKQSDVGDILTLVGSISSVSFILTMRGTEYPASNSVEWSTPHLPVLTQLELAAAREAFLKIVPAAIDDPELESLLKELGCMPLAITLMAKLALQGEAPSELLFQWRSEKTGMLSQADGDRRNCIEVSIKVSLESRAVKAYPEAIALLSVLAVLPAGACLARLPSLCPSIPNWRKALRILHNAALVHDSSDKTFVQVLSPISSYMLLHHPLDKLRLNDLQKAYCQLAEKGKLEPKEDGFHSNVKELAQEEANMEIILLGMLDTLAPVNEEALQASLNYSTYCYNTCRQTSTTKAAVNAAKVSGSELLPRCLQSLGNSLFIRARYSEARAALEEATAKFTEVGSELDVAKCLRSLGNVLRTSCRYDEARCALEEGRYKFIALGDRLGAATCLMALGNIMWVQNQCEGATAILNEARAEFITLEYQFGATQCLRSLGDILRIQEKYDAATSALEEARADFIFFKAPLGAAGCSWSLGDILRMQGRYDEAGIALHEARVQYLALGNHLGAAGCLQSLGDILRMQERYIEAKAILEEARHNFFMVGSQLGVVQCQQSLGIILWKQHRYDEARMILDEARTLFNALGNTRCATQCQQLLDQINNMSDNV